MVSDERCENCRFWIANKYICEQLGDCKRYPPLKGSMGGNDTAYYGAVLLTRSYDWCGEWQVNSPPSTTSEE